MLQFGGGKLSSRCISGSRPPRDKTTKAVGLPIFTARRYAKRGICRRRVSCVCVCVSVTLRLSVEILQLKYPYRMALFA